MGADAPLLSVVGISKLFGGTQALASVSMSVDSGEIVALLGENGAGKSTLIKILAGVHPLDAGQIFTRGEDVTGNVRKLPIAFIHQDLGLIEWMTVAENISLTLGYPRRNGLIDWDAARARAAAALRQLDVDIDPDVRVQSLSRTEKSLVAIARALVAQTEILVLDEPTASLPADEVARLFVALRKLRGNGVGIIYVSHRLDEVFEIADRMVVLRDGRVAGERRIAETNPEETILLIVGREPSQVFRRPPQRDAQRGSGSKSLQPTGRAGVVRGAGRRSARAGGPSRRRPGTHQPRAVRTGPDVGGQVVLDGERCGRGARRRRWRSASISSAPIASANRSFRTSPSARICF